MNHRFTGRAAVSDGFARVSKTARQYLPVGPTLKIDEGVTAVPLTRHNEKVETLESAHESTA